MSGHVITTTLSHVSQTSGDQHLIVFLFLSLKTTLNVMSENVKIMPPTHPMTCIW